MKTSAPKGSDLGDIQHLDIWFERKPFNGSGKNQSYIFHKEINRFGEAKKKDVLLDREQLSASIWSSRKLRRGRSRIFSATFSAGSLELSKPQGVEQEILPPDELAARREEIREMSEEMDAVLDDEGVTLSPRIAAARQENPNAAGRAKTEFANTPPLPALYQAAVHDLGAVKYGAYNWRETTIKVSDYISAARQHLALFEAGENLDDESCLPHLAHIMTTCAIVIDADLGRLAGNAGRAWAHRRLAAHDRQHHGARPLSGSGRKRGTHKEGFGQSRGGFTSKIHARADGQGRPLGFVLTGGEASDYKAIDDLIALHVAKPGLMLADKDYDSDDVRATLLL